jgi:hypothetical protein
MAVPKFVWQAAWSIALRLKHIWIIFEAYNRPEGQAVRTQTTQPKRQKNNQRTTRKAREI